jgi:hypothetical protein
MFDLNNVVQSVHARQEIWDPRFGCASPTGWTATALGRFRRVHVGRAAGAKRGAQKSAPAMAQG